MSEFLKEIDIYGSQMGFTFKGNATYSTLCGRTCSVLSFMFLIFFYSFKTLDFLGKVDPRISMVEDTYDPTTMFDLHKLGFRFAVRNIDPKYGRLDVKKIIRRVDKNNMRNDTQTSIKMVPCDDLIFQEDSHYIFREQNLRSFQYDFLNIS